MSIDLKLVRLFAELSEAQLESLRLSSESRLFEPDSTIFKEGDPGDGIYLIADGAVRISVRMPNEQLCQLARLERGDFFGEMAVLDQGPRSASVIALIPTEVIFIPRQIILDLFHESSLFALRLFNETSARLREFNQKYVEESLQAERLSLVGRFARSIVHDFKNPLNVIRLASEFSLQSSADQKVRKTTHDQIAQQVDRLSGMINELLEFTRGDRAEIVLSPSNYGYFISQIIQEMGMETSSRGVRLVLDSELLDVELSFDPRRLKHVFHNLVSNAADAMSDGGVVYFRIRLAGRQLETDIEDTGPGVHPDISSRLFEAFATHGKKQGTGLGLSICQKIIHDHRGEIKAIPNPGKGALFRISLPV
ncbi:MAG: cyclic nucleotide-binding domain-containing protein [Verrucomicrobia bacterium]|jgi:signal transduction histidine kinase|nr:cyclic nucleotide-binding domain-containing protein [Verrucomicrobiota bacterium]